MYILLASQFPAQNPENTGRKTKMFLLLHASYVSLMSNISSTLAPLFYAASSYHPSEAIYSNISYKCRRHSSFG